MTIIVRRPTPPLAGLISAIACQAGEQPRTSVQKILPDPEPSLWVNQAHLIDEFQDLADITPGDYLLSRIDGPNHVRV